MFTGIIETTGRLAAVSAAADGLQIWIEAPELDFSDVKLGDSIASNGVCLTVTALKPGTFRADVSGETVSKTLFGSYKTGQRINLEKALLPTTRLGGHLVSGHVDAVASIEKIVQTGNSWQVYVAAPQELQRYLAHKGSVTIDGISLTVNELTPGGFRLTIVPHTAAQTTIGQFKAGTKVHLEVDLIARYLERLLTCQRQSTTPESTTQQSHVSLELLAKSGFL